ncbi:hypothetical protein [Hymenobacter cheonanensis]|uniref:hypothetical protein n=1 Tax=Hymenobacter sp. CA2-7 TaxID=3063993 RepID=UPI0027139827|nr:hypothetical protein [Hymenobacter sp. CA2-7]MDO7887682.1 hypothetical protein [Hymenobacter sp. CA2-7]
MIDPTKFDHLFPKFDHLFALNDRIQAIVNPLGEVQKGLEAAMKSQRLFDGMVGSQQWLDRIGMTNAMALSMRMEEAFKTLTFPALIVLNAAGSAHLGLASFVPKLSPEVISLMENMELVQGGFFKKWTGLATVLEQPGWVKQLAAMEARFGHLFADLVSEATEAATEELEASTVLSSQVFALGDEILADPVSATLHIQPVLAACAALLARALNSKTRVLLQDLIIYLTFIITVRDKLHEAFPAPAALSVGEVAIQQEMRENRTQTALLNFQLARQNGQVQLTPRAVLLRTRPAGKASSAGKLPGATELLVGAQVRTWVQVSGFNEAGELVQGWLPAAQLQPKPAAPDQKAAEKINAAPPKTAANTTH